MKIDGKTEESWRSTGFMKVDDITLPSEERMAEGPVAVIECPEKIPCDPCQDNCPVGAIKLNDINDTPEVDFDKCTGCSICVESCPGLAIFTVDCSPGDGCDVSLPYEFTLPEIGEAVIGLNREGDEITEARVVKVKTREESTRDTPVVTVRVSEKFVEELRNIRRKE